MTFNIFRFFLVFVILSNMNMAIAADRILHADQIINDTNSSKINNQLGFLYDASGNESLDWINRRCKDPAGIFSFDWNNRITWDAAEITSIDWGFRQLQNAAGFSILNWENQYLYDAGGVQAFNWTDATQLNAGLNIDQVPDGMSCCTGTTHLNLNTQINNSADVIYEGYTNFDASMRFDPNNTGFKIGEAAGGSSSFYLMQATSDHVSSGEMGSLTGLNINLQFGDQSNVITGGKVGYTQGINNSISQYSGHDLFNYNGYISNGTIGGTMPDNSGFQPFSIGHNFTSTVGKINYQLMNHSPQFENDMTGHNPNGISNSWQFKNGSIAAVPLWISDFGQVKNGATVSGYQSANFSPQFETGSSITGGTSIVNIAPSGGGTFSSDVTALSSDVSQLTNVSPLVRTAGSFNGGKFNVNIDYNMPDSTQAVAPHTINSNVTIPSGSPISGTFGFGLGINTLFNAQDDMGDDGLGGLKLGYSNVAATGLMIVESGKTVDAYNGFTAAQAVVSPSAGTINKYRAFRAGGFAPGGGSLTVTDMVGFYSDVILCTFATDCWSFYDAAGGENYLSKLAIGTANKKVSTNVKLEVNDGHVVYSQTNPPSAVVDANAGSTATCSIIGASSDNALTVNLITGTSGWASGSQCEITFDQPFGATPRCTIGATNINAAIAATNFYITPSNTGITLNFVNADTASTPYGWDIICIGN